MMLYDIKGYPSKKQLALLCGLFIFKYVTIYNEIGEEDEN